MLWCVTTIGSKYLSLRHQLFRFLINRSAFSSSSHLQNEAKVTHEKASVVYEGQLTRVVKGVKFFSFSTSFLGLMCQPILISKSLATSSIIVGSVGAFIAFYSILTPLVLHWIVRRYVVQLYFDSNTKSFTSVNLGFFNKRKQLQFSASDVSVPVVDSPLTTFIVRGKPMLVDPQRFTDLSIYGHLMGFDKPVDLQLGKNVAETK